MSKRYWKHLQQGTTYTLAPGNGWAFTMNSDGSVSLAFAGASTEAKNADLAVDPDPGQGGDIPPI